ncbi:MAG TPA: diaminobutyrate--2-oxoglutarate transaminase [Acidimicrobiales bacterium]|nr:diaminobutyrate--2-oxoglutarate transaminase [Acidimicrobiales bacterium]
MNTFESLESEVRSYCRTWPAVFDRAQGDSIYDVDGRQYLDFFSGAGALNYGHNHPALKRKLIEYIERDGITHSLDTHTSAKRAFLDRFDETILQPRGMRYKTMFPGPTGTNAVESALKLARKITGRETVVGFTNGFHGMTLGSLSVTGNAMKRAGAGVSLPNATCMPFDGYLGGETDTLGYFEAVLDDSGSGVDTPAAVIIETVQAEGGINVASFDWLRRLADLCARFGIMFIVDDIQVGCGRTGSFFSFDKVGIEPDIICLSKSLSGYGLPLATVLMKPEHDVFSPGEHNGTFRGHNPAFVTATEALSFWEGDTFSDEVLLKGQTMGDGLREIADGLDGVSAELRGRGMLKGLAFDRPDLAGLVARAAFTHGLLIETAGPDDEVLKLLPPLTIEEERLETGLEIIHAAAHEVLEGAVEEVSR